MTDKKTKRIEMLPCQDTDNERSGVFVLHDEDHTLGNSLRYIILKNPEVEMCAYSIPHPIQKMIHLRIQTHEKSEMTALEVLKKGLKDLSGICSHIIETFNTEVDHYKSTHQVEEEEVL